MTHKVLFFALALVFAGCAGNGDDTAAPTEAPEATEEAAPSPAADCTDATGDAPVSLTERDFEFDPPCLVVNASQSLEIQNEGQVQHNFSIEGQDVDLDTAPGEQTGTEALSGVVEGGQDYRFFCKFHEAQGMEGELQVQAG